MVHGTSGDLLKLKTVWKWRARAGSEMKPVQSFWAVRKAAKCCNAPCLAAKQRKKWSKLLVSFYILLTRPIVDCREWLLGNSNNFFRFMESSLCWLRDAAAETVFMSLNPMDVSRYRFLIFSVRAHAHRNLCAEFSVPKYQIYEWKIATLSHETGSVFFRYVSPCFCAGTLTFLHRIVWSVNK